LKQKKEEKEPGEADTGGFPLRENAVEFTWFIVLFFACGQVDAFSSLLYARYARRAYDLHP